MSVEVLNKIIKHNEWIKNLSQKIWKSEPDNLYRQGIEDSCRWMHEYLEIMLDWQKQIEKQKEDKNDCKASN